MAGQPQAAPSFFSHIGVAVVLKDFAVIGPCIVRVLAGARRRFYLAAGILISLSLSEHRAAYCQTFTNVTSATGINHNAYIPVCLSCAPTFLQEQSGGAAAGDFDGDGWPDLYVTRYFDADVLYRNNRDGTFSDVTLSAFPAGIDNHQTNGAAWGDVDNDGDLDLAVTTMVESRHLLYINDGAGHFTEDGAARGLQITGGLPTTAGTSVSMGDYDRDGYLDMYVGEWRGFGTKSSPSQARLFRNLGVQSPGSFVDVTATAGVAMDLTSGAQKGYALSFTPRFTDLDRDGKTDLAVTSDSRTSRLFWNDGQGAFVSGASAGINTGTNDMGFTTADFNGDGLLDWFVTSIGTGSGVAPSGNRLFLNNGDRTFTDITQTAGVREGGWGWGAEAFDYDNDGDLDIVHTNGMGVAPVDQTVLFKNIGTHTAPQFTEAATATGITDSGFGRGLLTFDYDQDGDLDLFIVNFNGPPILYRNDGGNAKSWLEIRTVGTQSNREGIGAYITVTPDLSHPELAYTTEISASSTYLSQSQQLAHFGLGDATHLDQIEVVWPSGYRQFFTDLNANQRLTVVEGLLADFDANDQVAATDLALLEQGFGVQNGALPSQGDADRDGDVEGADLLLWQRQLGRSVVSGILPSATPTPEPKAVTLVALAALLMLAPARQHGGAAIARKLRRSGESCTGQM
jgi:hypothetical protein